MPAACSIVVERLASGSYRATCPVFPGLEAVAATEEAARRAAEEAIGDRIRRRSNGEGPVAHGHPGDLLP